ncbi:hypothetical protein KBD59_04395 [Candidatus Gracilibacteria bacterium]|nr:hypothetical protein [Candidatus Gracilibacteria bacterium]
MALDSNPNSPQRPSERAPWGNKLREYTSPKGIASLEKALAIFAPHTTGDLSKDSELHIRRRAEADTHIEEAIEQTIRHISMKFIGRNGLLEIDPNDLVIEFGMGIGRKYPENMTDAAFGEAYVLNEVVGRVVSYFVAYIALNEKAHRSKITTERKKGMQTSKPTHGSFFALIDGQINHLLNTDPELLRTAKKIIDPFNLTQQYWMPLLRENRFGEFKDDETNREVVRKENDRIAQEIFARARKTLPLCTVEDTSLLKDKPLIMQFAPMDPSLNQTSACNAQVSLFESELGTQVADNEELQRALQSKAVGSVADAVPVLGSLPSFFVSRARGELMDPVLGPEGLRLIAGKSAHYELLRKNILWYLAHLICRKEDVEEIFGIEYKHREGHGKGQPRDPGSVSQHVRDRVSATRIVPSERTSQNDSDVDDEEDRNPSARQLRQHKVGGHTRLLPLVRRPDGSVIAPKPSAAAMKLAGSSVVLERGLENSITGQVVYPEQMNAFLRDHGYASIDQTVEAHPDQWYVRYETFISDFVRGSDTIGVVGTIKASVEQTMR